MKSRAGRKLIMLEGIFFAIVIIFSWVNELLDLPHYFMGAPDTPANWRESLFESIIMFLLAVTVITVSIRLVKQLEYFESCLIVCALCKKIKINDEWVLFERFLSQKYEVEFAPSLCSECARKRHNYIKKQD